MKTGEGKIRQPRSGRKRRFLIVFCCAAAILAFGLVRLLWPQPDPLYKVTILPSLGGRPTMPYAINDRGQVAGVSSMASGDHHLFL